MFYNKNNTFITGGFIFAKRKPCLLTPSLPIPTGFGHAAACYFINQSFLCPSFYLLTSWRRGLPQKETFSAVLIAFTPTGLHCDFSSFLSGPWQVALLYKFHRRPDLHLLYLQGWLVILGWYLFPSFPSVPSTFSSDFCCSQFLQNQINSSFHFISLSKHAWDPAQQAPLNYQTTTWVSWFWERRRMSSLVWCPWIFVPEAGEHDTTPLWSHLSPSRSSSF